MSNEHPSMETWQADAYATWAILGEIVAMLDACDKIDWDAATKRTQEKCDKQMHQFVRTTVQGICEAAEQASTPTIDTP